MKEILTYIILDTNILEFVININGVENICKFNLTSYEIQPNYIFLQDSLLKLNSLNLNYTSIFEISYIWISIYNFNINSFNSFEISEINVLINDNINFEVGNYIDYDINIDYQTNFVFNNVIIDGSQLMNFIEFFTIKIPNSF